MPNASTLGIRQTCENVWLAWLKTKAIRGTPLGSGSPLVSFFHGQSTEEIQLPAVVVAVNSARELLEPGSGYYEADVDILIMSSPSGGKDADAFQAALAGQVEALLYGPNPGDSASMRVVADEVQAAAPPNVYYSIHGFWIEEQGGSAVEDHWIDQIKLKVHCTPNSGLAAPSPV